MKMWKTNVKISTSTKKFGHLKMSNIDIILNFFDSYIVFWNSHGQNIYLLIVYLYMVLFTSWFGIAIWVVSYH